MSHSSSIIVNQMIGAYTHSKGLPVVREEVAAFIQARDGYPVDPEDIFLSDGASSAIKSVLTAVIRDEKDGIMVPIPQYPLYSASIAILGGSLQGYELDESKNWGLSEAQLKASVEAARARGVTVRALVVINPGNPTGQCLTADNIKQVSYTSAYHTTIHTLGYHFILFDRYW
jgi:aspartate/methionine/tyrosine aminotransferase